MKWLASKALADVAVAGGVAALAVYHVRRRAAASRLRRAEASSSLQTWEGEGGNVPVSAPRDMEGGSGLASSPGS